MKNSKTLVALVVISIVIAIIGWVMPVGQNGQTIVEKLGASPGPDFSSPYLNYNGDEVWYSSMKFNTASTTRCAIQAPKHATSTLSFDSVVRSATTTDYTLAIAKATTAYATTTTFLSQAVTAAGEVVYTMASTTYNALALTDRTFAPGEWLVVSAAGPTATAFTSGSCSAVFVVGAK